MVNRHFISGACMSGAILSYQLIVGEQSVEFTTFLAVRNPLSEVGGGECKLLDVMRTNLGVLLHRARTRLRQYLETKKVR